MSSDLYFIFLVVGGFIFAISFGRELYRGVKYGVTNTRGVEYERIEKPANFWLSMVLNFMFFSFSLVMIAGGLVLLIGGHL